MQLGCRRSCHAARNLVLVAIFGPALWSCASTHPTVQGAAIGAASCGAIGAAVSGRKAAGQGALLCGALGAGVGHYQENSRRTAQSREEGLNQEIQTVRQANQKLQEYNGQLRMEHAQLTRAAAQYRRRHAISESRRNEIRYRIMEARSEAQRERSHIQSLISQTHRDLANLRPGEPNYPVKSRDLQERLRLLRMSAANLDQILEIRI